MANGQYKQGSLFEEYAENNEVQSKSELANPWAIDCDGNPILPENAERHGSYICPKCHEPLTIHKRGKREHSRRDHFCHKADTTCKGYNPHETESYIHKTAKAGIYKILQSCIDKNEQFTVSWTCPTCGKQFSGNILHQAKSVKIEKQFEDKADGQDHKQPDVSLVDENGKLLVAIEVVYTHDIEQETWAFYDANNIVVVRLVFESVEDLNDLQKKLQNPTSVNVCFNITCKECQTMHQPRNLKISKDDDGAPYIYAAIHNPFDDIDIQGLPLTELEITTANDWVKRQSKIHTITLCRDERSNFHFARIVRQQAAIQQPPRQYRPFVLKGSPWRTTRRKYKTNNNQGNKSRSSSTSYGKTNRSKGKSNTNRSNRKGGGWGRRK